MSAYRFCRTDDIGLLAEALNRCWSPYFPDEPPMTPAAFKRSIRDLQVWCSSCMVAFSGSEPIGVLIGAKRTAATLVHRIAVHPDHRRQGHGHHLLESLGSKLAILGPPRLVAEVPEAFEPARALFRAAGFVEEAVLTDYVWEGDSAGLDEAVPGRLVIPVTIDDLDANGLLAGAQPATCWARSIESLVAQKDDIDGLAVASDEGIESYILYIPGGFAPPGPPSPSLAGASTEILSMRSFVEDGGARLRHLLSRVAASGSETFRFPKVHPAEMPGGCLESLGFRAAARHRLYTAILTPV